MSITPEIITEWLQYVMHDPWLLGLALAAATFATEDGALITGSLLVGSGMISPFFAIAALAGGIIIGDIGLYLLGWSARSNDFLRKRLPVKKSRPLRRWLNGREAGVLFASRFTPGTRLITYVTFGFLKLSLIRFTIVMTIAGVLWVTGMVIFVSEIQQLLAQFGTLPSLIVALLTAITLIVFVPRLIKKWSHAKTINDAEADTRHA